MKKQKEIAEIEVEMARGDKERTEEEIGDLFFALINASRLYGIDPEQALERTNRKFIHRFGCIEKGAAEQGRELGDLSLEEMEELWQKAKKCD